MSIEVKGLGELAKKLAKLGGTDTAISNGTREAARIVNNSAKELCPVDNGDLRASLHTDYKREGSKHIGSVLTNVEYAAYVEFGTGPKGNGTYTYELPGGIHYKADKWRGKIPGVGWRMISGQKAQPYLYPALINNREAILECYKRAIQQEINRKGGQKNG